MSDAPAPYETDDQQQEIQPEPSSGGRGCLYGCLLVVFGSVALLVCAGFAGWWWFTSQVEKFTSATPAEIPSVVYEGEKLAELQARVKTFSDAVDAGEAPPEELVLTADDINALIAENDKMKGKAFVRIEDGQVSADVSIPTDAIPGGKGRYFNGSASCEVSMNGGVLIVTLTDASVNDERIPQEAIDAMARENLAKGVYDDPDTAKVLRQFESISVEGDKIILKPKKDDGKGDEESDAAAAESEPAEEATEEAAGEAADEAAGDADPAEDADVAVPAKAESLGQ